jgi:DNA-binding MarR family transcriptional regulator
MDDMRHPPDDPDHAPPPEGRLGFMLYRAGLAVSRGYERALAPIAVSPTEAGVLTTLIYAGPAHVRGLARQLGLGRQTIVNVTRSLESAGLVKRSASPDDARLALFSITAKGRTRFASIERIARAFDAELSALVDAKSERTLLVQLQRVIDAPMFVHED